MTSLATRNNDAAAKTAKTRNRPYVPWDLDEIGEPDFFKRLPLIEGASIKGWKIVGRLFHPDKHILSRWIKSQGGDRTLGFIFSSVTILEVYEPLPEAHEPLKSEGRRN